MEQWQFLIQKEGERTWHLFEKPNIEITEGRYRVVARSNRTNTDVEVRVTHSSPSELPPIRRIQKRVRRVNSEGLTAIIPFTYLKSGMWELQCSGDLMSDLLGGNWQYTVNLVVIPSRVEGKVISPKKPNHNSDKQYKVAGENIQTNQAVAKIKNAQSSRYPISSKDFKTNDAGLISSISIEAVTNIGSSRNVTGKLSSTPPNTGKKASDKAASEKPADKLRHSLKAASDKQKAVTKKSPRKSTQKVSTTQNKAVSEIPTQKLAEKAKVPEKAVNASPAQKQSAKSKSVITSNKTVNKKSTQESLEKSQATLNKKDVSEKTVKKSTQKPKITNQKDVNEIDPKEVTAIAEKNSNPLRIKGDTAEQILQNLMELALPSSEPLLLDDSIEDTLIATPPLPLLLTLDKDSHVASWGSTITLEGVVHLKETTQRQIKHITSAEVEIELRSPQNSQLLQSFRLPNPNKSLPFAIACLINIPEECSSKLILGEVKLYGALSSATVELLASQSFTITAEIKELLAITVANPKGELEKFASSTEEFFARNASQILEESASLDLELFNLVKTVKPEQQSVTGIPLTKKSLPPRIDPRKLRSRMATHRLKLPNVPGYQEKIDQYINKGYIETFSGSAITGTSFPFLRKLKAMPSRNVEVDEDIYDVEESTYTSSAESQNITETSLQTDNSSQAELVVDEKDDYMHELEEPVTPRNSEFIAGENNYTSPLIRQWMLSQGYSVPEPINVEYEDYDIEVRQDSYQQASLSPNPQADDNSQVLHSQKAQIDIQPTPSPYISISTSSQWQVNQVTAPSTQNAQEIVVDNTDIFADDILTGEKTEPDRAIDDKAENLLTAALTISTQKLEDLPTPELYLQQGELISGKSLNVRVRLPEGNSHLGVKLWLEDCHTRHLLDGPHLLTNLTPNKNQHLEIITKLNVPFGCLEIRLEAVAINRSTQQESHKFTIQRTVIPPDLPNVQFDAILGM